MDHPIGKAVEFDLSATVLHNQYAGTKIGRKGRIMTDYSNAQVLRTRGIFKGIVDGNARVQTGSNLEVKGIINGDLFIEFGSKVLVSGIVDGQIINNGADVAMTGIIG
jgi:cytoskeletal protein CcmA (bactofilin family)